MNKKIYVLCTSAVTLLDRVKIRDVVKRHFNNDSDLIYVPKLDNKKYLAIQDATHILVACNGKNELNKLMFIKDFTVRSSCSKLYAKNRIATINPNSLEIRNILKAPNCHEYEIGLVTNRFLDNLIGSVTSTKPKDLDEHQKIGRPLRTKDSLYGSNIVLDEILGGPNMWVKNEEAHSIKYDAEIVHKTISEIQNLMSYSTTSITSAFSLDLQKRTANVTTYDNKRLNFDLKLLLF